MENNTVTKVQWHQSILVRVILINIIMFIVFNMVMYTTMDSLSSTVSMAGVMMEYVSGASAHANNVSADTYYLYGQPYAYHFADNSRQTAGNIQQISEGVTDAVKSLSDNAMQVLDFINTTVLADYDAFVEVGEKYENTSGIIDGMLETFSEKADNLNAIMDEMSTAVTSISDSVRESSEAISMSASNSAEIVDEMKGIGTAMDNSNKVASQLSDSTRQFIKV